MFVVNTPAGKPNNALVPAMSVRPNPVYGSPVGRTGMRSADRTIAWTTSRRAATHIAGYTIPEISSMFHFL
jgi:hypothetical protein